MKQLGLFEPDGLDEVVLLDLLETSFGLSDLSEHELKTLLTVGDLFDLSPSHGPIRNPESTAGRNDARHAASRDHP